MWEEEEEGVTKDGGDCESKGLDPSVGIEEDPFALFEVLSRDPFLADILNSMSLLNRKPLHCAINKTKQNQKKERQKEKNSIKPGFISLLH